MARGQSIFDFGKYSFASWARRGLGNEIAPNGNTLVRAKLPLSIKFNNEEVRQDIELIGPADIANITRNAIVRTEPLDRDYYVEWNFLPYIEFYDEDFVWRYTPDSPNAQGNLRPWVALVVLTENEFQDLPSRRGALTAIRLQTDVLPPSADAHLWAHLHTGQHAGVTDLDKILVQIAENFPKDPDGFTCRLLSPRRLEKLTHYHAFLVPSFESGRLAGLGEDFSRIPARQAAWTDTDRPTSLDFPVYFRWSFATTEASFEDLISKMKTTPANIHVGIRDMDTSEPAYIKADGSAAVSPTNPPLLGLEGALRTPVTKSTEYKVDGTFDAFQKDVAALLNLYDSNSSTATPQYSEAKMDGDPILTIPLYGHPYANPRPTSTIPEPAGIKRDGKNWYSAINFDPRNRVAAGLGTQVVQQGQEAFMQSAWNQLQHLQKARNNIAAVGGILQKITDRFRNETLVSSEDFISMARGSLSRVKGPNAVTYLKQLTDSSIPNALIDSATRRLVGGNNKLVSRINSVNANPLMGSLLKQINSGLIADNARLLSRTRNRFVIQPININPVFVPPVLNSTQQAFYAAYNHWATRIPAPFSTPIKLFNFTEAKRMVFEAGTKTGMQFFRAQINLPALQAATVSRPPAEIVGQPTFFDSMYKQLLALDKEWLLPNLHLIENNTITLLETNPAFINAYMLGANQELGREMLWREYPADLSSTFFRNFWDPADGNLPPQYFDIEPIPKWLKERANPRQSAGEAAKLVLTLRGDLLKKFPNTVIFMANLKRNNQGELQPPAEGDFEFPTFKAELPPDLQFMGFNVETKKIKTPGTDGRDWYFILMEPVGEARFGLDADFRPNNAAVYSRNDLAWTHLKNPDLPDFITASNKPNLSTMPPAEKNLWGKDAAAMAALLFQQPFTVIIKATDLLTIQK